MPEWNLPDLIDHTVLRPDAEKNEVLRLCQEAKEHRRGLAPALPVPVPFSTGTVANRKGDSPFTCYVDEAVAALEGTAIRVGVPIGFPFGGHTTKAKVAEAVDAVSRGAQLLDMVINVGRLKSGDCEYVRKDIAEVVKSTPSAEHKVILETCYLTLQEKHTACWLVVEAGADYVKTSTGFGPAGATVGDVRLMKEVVAGRAKVKASGGIRDWKTTQLMLEARADRIGTSASLKILEEWKASLGKQS